MHHDELMAAIQVGRDAVHRVVTQDDVNVVCIGELGIGNTTCAAALLAALTGVAPALVCGRGTGKGGGCSGCVCDAACVWW